MYGGRGSNTRALDLLEQTLGSGPKPANTAAPAMRSAMAPYAYAPEPTSPVGASAHLTNRKPAGTNDSSVYPPTAPPSPTTPAEQFHASREEKIWQMKKEMMAESTYTKKKPNLKKSSDLSSSIKKNWFQKDREKNAQKHANALLSQVYKST